MKTISVDIDVSDEQYNRIMRLIPELNAFGSAAPDRAVDWTDKSVLELIFLSSGYFSLIDEQLDILDESLNLKK